jgi:hypothetical protein
VSDEFLATSRICKELEKRVSPGSLDQSVPNNSVAQLAARIATCGKSSFSKVAGQIAKMASPAFEKKE